MILKQVVQPILTQIVYIVFQQVVIGMGQQLLQMHIVLSILIKLKQNIVLRMITLNVRQVHVRMFHPLQIKLIVINMYLDANMLIVNVSHLEQE